MHNVMLANAMVYLVDDADDYRFLIGQVFTRFLPQYTVRFFASGDALYQHIINDETASNPGPDALRSSGPGLILLDMHMPGRNGLQTLKEIRQHAHWQRIPVIMMSNAASQQERDACYETGANSFLVKPADLGQMRETLQTVCHYWLQVNQRPSASSDLAA